MGRGLQLASGRVIALGRLLLATLFLIAIWIDVTQPSAPPRLTYALLIGYVGFAVGAAAATWSNWWLDAKLAGPAHAIDILTFTALVVATQGYTSPYFTFFIFLLLSAAIRWGWRETALTAILVTLLYLAVGMIAGSSEEPFDLYRFVVRTGHLVIMSLVLIWFGINRWGARYRFQGEELLAEPLLDKSPIETALRAAMKAARARGGAFLWWERNNRQASGFALTDQEPMAIGMGKAPAGLLDGHPFLFDVARDRGLTRDSDPNLTIISTRDRLGDAVQTLGLRNGIAIPVRTDAGEGILFLVGVRGLSTDHIDFGEQIAAEVAAHIQRHALLRAAEESAEARSRLALARDLHDSVVQFLAGAAFRLEAMKRSKSPPASLEPQLDELKQLMLQEQGELRSFITALRSGAQVSFRDLLRDLESLATRLSRQWGMTCIVTGEAAQVSVPTRLHLDCHQLVREAVANAVRHAGANRVTVSLEAKAEHLLLAFINDGEAFPKRGGRIEMPQSLRERVEQAGGDIEVSRGMNLTKLTISLPIRGNRR